MISEKQIIKNRENILGLLDFVKRDGTPDLAEFLEQSDFFLAPASTKFHSNYPGGLAEHTYETYMGFARRVKEYDLPVFPESIILSSVCHDLCKIGVYFENSLKGGKRSEYKPYKFEDTFPYGHGEKSVFIASKYIDLTPQESMIIRWHMGGDDPSWKDYSESVEKLFPEVVFFQHVDKEVSILHKH